MKLQTTDFEYIYTFKFDYHHRDLFDMESRQIFGKQGKDKLLFSDIEIDPSISPFIKNRLQIISSAQDYSEILQNIKNVNIHVEGFKVEYLILTGDSAEYTERLNKLKDVGYSIEGEPDYYNPSVTYAICNYKHIWYFGILSKHNTDWHKHKKKPCSFSNSISMDIAKTLVSMASKGKKTIQLLDACCGVGTAMLEACCAGFTIEGCDINWKACKHTRENLAHYSYSANVYCTDIKDHDKAYDAAIIDLPYNLYAYSNSAITLNIIASTAILCSRIVIVSFSDIEAIINDSGLRISDFCTVEKRGKSKFTRNIWICESSVV